MLRPIDPSERRVGVAHRVPWVVDINGRRVTAINQSADVLVGVIACLYPTGELLVPHASLVPPGGALAFHLPASVAATSTAALLAWRWRGGEYLYRVAL